MAFLRRAAFMRPRVKSRTGSSTAISATGYGEDAHCTGTAKYYNKNNWTANCSFKGPEYSSISTSSSFSLSLSSPPSFHLPPPRLSSNPLRVLQLLFLGAYSLSCFKGLTSFAVKKPTDKHTDIHTDIRALADGQKETYNLQWTVFMCREICYPTNFCS